MKIFARVFICLTIIIICCFSLGISVSATSYINSSDKQKIEKLLAETDSVDGKCNKIHITYYDDDGNSKETDISVVKFNSGSNTYLYNMEQKNDGSYVEESKSVNSYVGNRFFVMEADYRIVECLPDEDRRIILNNIKDAFNNKDYGISSEAKQMFYNELRVLYGDDIEYIQGEIISGVQPNMFTAYELFLPFRSIIGTILGCICIIIIVSLVFSVILDVMYMQVPEFRERTYQATQRGGGGRFSMVKNRSQIDRPWFVSYEAARASKESIESNGTKNVLLIYMRYRVVTWIVVGICLTYLLTGMFMNVTNVIWGKAPQVFDIATWGA